MTQDLSQSFLEKVMFNSEGLKILLVDDEPDTLMLTSFTLTRAGYNVVAAESGPQALAIFDREKPAMIILDRMMPEMDGLDVCRQLREKDAELYIIILTALDTESDRIAGWEAGCDDYVGKPINYKELVLRVRAKMRRINLASNSPVSVSPRHAKTITDELKTFEVEDTTNSPARRLQALLVKASRAAQIGNPALAREQYVQALELDPANATALKWLAYHTLDPHEGCYYLEQLVVAQPQNLKARRLLDIGRQRCKELDQQAFSSILSYMGQPAPLVESIQTAPLSLPRRQIGQLLIEKAYITRENLETATTLQEMFRRTGAPKKLGEILVEYGVLSEEQLKRVLTEQGSQK